MKARERNLALVATVPVLILAALLGLKWKRDNPIPTGQDLTARQCFAEADYVQVSYHSPLIGSWGQHEMRLRTSDLQNFYDHFLFLRPNTSMGMWAMNQRTIDIYWVHTAKKRGDRKVESRQMVRLNLDSKENLVTDDKVKTIVGVAPGSWVLHPISAKHLMKVLLGDPQLAAKLRRSGVDLRTLF